MHPTPFSKSLIDRIDRYLKPLVVILIFFCGSVLSMTHAFASENQDDFNILRLPFGREDHRCDLVKVDLNTIVSADTGKPTTAEEFFRKLENYDVIIVGESHTSDEHHQVQRRVIEGLSDRGHKVALALEMFNPSQNHSLADFINGAFPDSEFMEKTGWFRSWGHNFRYYQPIFQLARARNIPMKGVNLPSELVTKARKGGIASFTEEEKRLMPSPDTTNAEHRFLVNAMMQGIGAQVPEMFTGMYQSQCLWDAAMGEGAIKVADDIPDAKVIVLAGTGHVAYNLGIARIVASRSRLKVASILPVDIPHPTEAAPNEANGKKPDMKKQFAVHLGSAENAPQVPHYIVSRGAADFFIGVPEEPNEKYPTLGMSLKDGKEGVTVVMVMPETLAERKGFIHGDVLLSANGRVFAKVQDLKSWLTFMNWGDPVDFTIRREGRNKHLRFKMTREKGPRK